MATRDEASRGLLLVAGATYLWSLSGVFARWLPQVDPWTFNATRGLGMGIALLCLWVSHYLLGFTSALADNIATNVVGLALGTAFVVLVIGALGYFALPPLVRSMVVDGLSKQLHRPVSVEGVSINPYTLSVQVAGLVIQEMLLRHRARTVLVLCPASLQEKWRTEMQEKFGLDFRVVASCCSSGLEGAAISRR